MLGHLTPARTTYIDLKPIAAQEIYALIAPCNVPKSWHIATRGPTSVLHELFKAGNDARRSWPHGMIHQVMTHHTAAVGKPVRELLRP